MKRHRIDLETIAGYHNLMDAAAKAAKGKRRREEVQAFFAKSDMSLKRLRDDILQDKAPEGTYRSFYVFDPKKRQIQAASFKDRVLHHAIMNVAGPIFERGLIPNTYACRLNKGTVAAIKQVQKNGRRYPWTVQIDIQHYFDNVDHRTLLALLERRFKGPGFIRLLRRIIESYSTREGKGLPIGSLTSQYFANYYLDGIDRTITEKLPTLGYVRYMDDMIWWCEDKESAKLTLEHVETTLRNTRQLAIKSTKQINQSKNGISYCGCRILPGKIRLSHRRKKQYATRRQTLERAFKTGNINEHQLQTGYASILATTAHTDSQQWRRENLRHQPSIEM